MYHLSAVRMGAMVKWEHIGWSLKGRRSIWKFWDFFYKYLLLGGGLWWGLPGQEWGGRKRAGFEQGLIAQARNTQALRSVTWAKLNLCQPPAIKSKLATSPNSSLSLCNRETTMAFRGALGNLSQIWLWSDPSAQCLRQRNNNNK